MRGRTSQTSSRELLAALSTRELRLRGREIFPGVGTPVSCTTRYGATFAGVEKGKVSVALFGWVNYTPIFFKPRTRCAIVGGCWWLVATEGLRYRGALRGSFDGGMVSWNKDAKLAKASIDLKVFCEPAERENPGNTGTFTAILNHLSFPPRITGVLSLGNQDRPARGGDHRWRSNSS